MGAQKAADRIATIHFIDGSRLSLDFPEQSPSAMVRQLKIADVASGKHLIVEAEGSILVVPTANIKYIALSLPVLTKESIAALPRHAITGARIRD